MVPMGLNDRLVCSGHTREYVRIPGRPLSGSRVPAPRPMSGGDTQGECWERLSIVHGDSIVPISDATKI